MIKTMKRLGLLTLLGWSAQASTSVAQTPTYVEVVPATFIAPASNRGIGAYTPLYANDSPPVPISQRNGPWQTMCDNYKERLGCAADFNNPGCGSCYSHLLFMFGSCRTFFGPGCYPNPYYTEGYSGYVNGGYGNAGYGNAGYGNRCSGGSCGN
jgi:hypothetical protein